LHLSFHFISLAGDFVHPYSLHGASDIHNSNTEAHGEYHFWSLWTIFCLRKGRWPMLLAWHIQAKLSHTQI